MTSAKPMIDIERRADFVADLGEEVGFRRRRFFRVFLRGGKLALGILPRRDVAQDEAEPLAAAGNPAHGHEQGNLADVTHAAGDLASLRRRRRRVVSQPFEALHRGPPAVRHEEIDEDHVGEVAGIAAEQRRGAAVAGEDATVAIDDEDAVRRCVDDRAQLPASLSASRSGSSAALALSSMAEVTSMRTRAGSPFQGMENRRPSTGSLSPLLAAMAIDLPGPVISPGADRPPSTNRLSSPPASVRAMTSS